MSDLQLAKDEVEPMLDQIDKPLSNEVLQTALEYAHKADMEYPINRSPKSVAAGSIYFASLLCNEKITQSKLSESVNVSESAIRESYLDIAEAEGFDIRRERQTKRRVPPRIERIQATVANINPANWFGGTDE